MFLTSFFQLVLFFHIQTSILPLFIIFWGEMYFLCLYIIVLSLYWHKDKNIISRFSSCRRNFTPRWIIWPSASPSDVIDTQPEKFTCRTNCKQTSPHPSRSSPVLKTATITTWLPRVHRLLMVIFNEPVDLPSESQMASTHTHRTLEFKQEKSPKNVFWLEISAYWTVLHCQSQTGPAKSFFIQILGCFYIDFAASSPVERLSEILPLHVKLEDGSLAVCGGVVTSTVLLQEGVETVLRRVFLTAHKHHWKSGRRRNEYPETQNRNTELLPRN